MGLLNSLLSPQPSKYYSLDAIKKENADINILIGERANGKSYAVKKEVLTNIWNNREQEARFGYIRRFAMENNATSVAEYFDDAPFEEITGGEMHGITSRAGQIFFSQLDPKTGTRKTARRIGNCFTLAEATHYKSLSYPNTNEFIFEEFITEFSYLKGECSIFEQLLSTVARKRQVKVWLVGNSVSQYCPYFEHYELMNVRKQEQGTIETYLHFLTDKDGRPLIDEEGEQQSLKIAVEYAADSPVKSGMFMSKKGASNNISGGAWRTEAKPRLPKPIEHYKNPYTFFVKDSVFCFEVAYLTSQGERCFHVSTVDYKLPLKSRVITDFPSPCSRQTSGFVPLSKAESELFRQFKHGAVFYSDNLTGTNFKSCLKNMQSNK